MVEAISLYATESPYEIRSLRNRLIAKQAELVDALTSAQDWADYKFRLGQIRGNADAIIILDEITKRERN